MTTGKRFCQSARSKSRRTQLRSLTKEQDNARKISLRQAATADQRARSSRPKGKEPTLVREARFEREVRRTRGGAPSRGRLSMRGPRTERQKIKSSKHARNAGARARTKNGRLARACVFGVVGANALSRGWHISLEVVKNLRAPLSQLSSNPGRAERTRGELCERTTLATPRTPV